MGYAASSGNIKGIYDGIKAGGIKSYANLTNKEKSEKFVKEWTEFQQQGLQGSNIDLNQAVNRIQDIADTTGDRSIASKLLFLGKPEKKQEKFIKLMMIYLSLESIKMKNKRR